MQIAGTLGCEPEASLPVATGNDSDLEATYRFLNNDRVTAEEILRPHLRETLRRCGEATRLVVAHDTTELNFGRNGREDLGRVGRGKSFGFYAHLALAIDDGEVRRPAGVLGFEIHTRSGTKGRRGHAALQRDGGNESRRWTTLFDRLNQELGAAAIHVMDREADSYALMAHLIERRARFVVRMAGMKRVVADEMDATVADVVASAEVMAEREVPLTARGRNPLPSYRRLHPARRARTAKLAITATPVTIVRPASSSHRKEPCLTLNVVRVVESGAPEGETPIEWRLWTTEAIGTAAEVLAVVDAYRCRWMIEEYFKALKTGCAIESRQLETQEGLVNALAIYTPIAWRLLLLRTLSRDRSESPAATVLSPVQLKCLAGGLKRLKRPPLPTKPTARDAMLGVAGLGGHIKNNGDPGWQVLGRGLDKLLLMEVGYLVATDGM